MCTCRIAQVLLSIDSSSDVLVQVQHVQPVLMSAALPLLQLLRGFGCGLARPKPHL
jgi:hypothetical protein